MKVLNNEEFYHQHKTDVDRMNQLITTRINNLTAIVSRMDANQWLTAAEQQMADQDTQLYNEQEALAKKLNGQ